MTKRYIVVIIFNNGQIKNINCSSYTDMMIAYEDANGYNGVRRAYYSVQ
jgi:hypothetical protein